MNGMQTVTLYGETLCYVDNDVHAKMIKRAFESQAELEALKQTHVNLVRKHARLMYYYDRAIRIVEAAAKATWYGVYTYRFQARELLAEINGDK